jgi:hypothetical protein
MQYLTHLHTLLPVLQDDTSALLQAAAAAAEQQQQEIAAGQQQQQSQHQQSQQVGPDMGPAFQRSAAAWQNDEGSEETEGGLPEGVVLVSLTLVKSSGVQGPSHTQWHFPNQCSSVSLCGA